MTKRILILKGESLYNVLRIAADYMADAFQKNGYQVIVLDLTMEEDRKCFLNVLENKYDLIYSFQALLFETEVGDSGMSLFSLFKDTPVFGHIVDHPNEHASRLISTHGDNMYIGCIDKSHVTYIHKYYPTVKHAIYLPHAGFSPKKVIPYRDREIDLFFPCSYKDPEEVLTSIDHLPEVYRNIAKHIISKLIENPLALLQDELEYYLQSVNFAYSGEEFTVLMHYMENVDQYIRAFIRDQCIRYLLSQNIKVTVSGSGWDRFQSEDKCNLEIVGENGLDFLEVLELMSNSKIVLNNAPTYQYGTHERIFTSMLCGSVCLTNDFPVIREEFSQDENIILYSMHELENLAARIKLILDDVSIGESIALKGYVYAKENHTWARNAEKILKMFNLINE